MGGPGITGASNVGGDTEANWNKPDERLQSMNIDDTVTPAASN